MSSELQGVIVGAIIGFFLTLIRDYLIAIFQPKPNLQAIPDKNAIESIPLPSEIEEGKQKNESGGTSWFLRLKVHNKGNETAHNCRARLIYVLTENKQINNIDRPLVLYWTAQNQKNPFVPIDIAPNSFDYLDIAQYQTYDAFRLNNKKDILKLRVVIQGGRLPQDNRTDLEPNSYYVKIGISCDGIKTEYHWFKIQKLSGTHYPYRLEVVLKEEYSSLDWIAEADQE
ncbi:MAG: hypothetical protein HY862_02255 [Chloroflexi bacterium]|nr:hypothetical protein [Chloroflexota bacterium]